MKIKKRLCAQKKVKECENKLIKANTISVENKSLKEIALHQEENMKAKVLML